MPFFCSLIRQKGLISCLYHTPVQDFPEFVEMGGAVVLVVQVVGVLPDVEGEEGSETMGYGVIGAGVLYVFSIFAS